MFLICRIKKIYDSKDTEKSPKKVKNVEAAASSDADVMVPKPAKRDRKEEFEQGQKVEAPGTENIVPYSQELLEVEKEG
ncbi:hypothetical protein RHMOL_Rhmol11G0178900 [Rhododendron molle]|uniref:Uncharacterized protein n=1 Tax=Rhododendron molle TaxID=49168 RepID=A0ACC0LV13_RHOML|nr:hypothetical protein RHMOL_Rhmol11G0178900 [Rhododendron molle]